MQDFYHKEKWTFRMHCRHKSSEARYGEDCTVHYGDWSRREQMKGCDGMWD